MNAQPIPVPFDSNRAWTLAVELMKANRDLLLALAGVFVVLPAFALAILFPMPPFAADADPSALIANFEEYYRHAAPALIVSALIHTGGTLAMLALFTDPTRPTVGQAIKQGFVRMPTVIVSQIVIGAAIGSMLLVPILLGGMAGSIGITLAGLLAALGLGIWALVRLALIQPSVMVERIRNPLEALRRSWQLTAGNALRLLAFYFLLVVVFFITTLLIGSAVQALVASLLDAESAMLASTFAAVCIQAAMTVSMTAVSTTVYRQLAGVD